MCGRNPNAFASPMRRPPPSDLHLPSARRSSDLQMVMSPSSPWASTDSYVEQGRTFRFFPSSDCPPCSSAAPIASCRMDTDPPRCAQCTGRNTMIWWGCIHVPPPPRPPAMVPTTHLLSGMEKSGSHWCEIGTSHMTKGKGGLSHLPSISKTRRKRRTTLQRLDTPTS